MEIKDKVYGDFVVEEPVLIELINSKPVQRLKGISQAGASKYVYDYRNVTRYEHSLGVMILLNKLGAPVEEQIAGLLHDIPHTAFSHVIDYVFKNDKEDFHEQFFEKIVMESEIPAILEKYGFEVSRILDEENFSLLEKSLPDLCADRIDYSLRDGVAFGVDKKEIKGFISNFIVKEGEIVINGKEIAKEYAEFFLKMDKSIWSNPLDNALMQILADAIKIALDMKVLSEKELFKDDIYVFNKMKESGNVEILQKLEVLNPNLKIIEDAEEYEFYSKSKCRFVDPKFVVEKGLKRVSEEYPLFLEEAKKHKEKVAKGYYFRIDRN